MQIERASLVKLAGFGVSAAAILAAHHSGEAATLAGAGLLLLDSVAHVGFEHLVGDFIHDVARRFDGAETARGVENRDLHRLIGATIARVLEHEGEHEVGRAPGGKPGAQYLKSAAAAFRGETWMNAELIGPQTVLAEVNVSNFFSGDPEAIKKAPVLEQGEWVKLVEGVAERPAVFAEFDAALNYAAVELREHFAFELWESVKNAWKKGDLAWPALVLRLLSLTLGHAGDAARNSAGLREEIAALRDDILRQAQPAIDNAKPSDQILIQAIQGYQGQIMGEIKTLQDLVREALANARLAPVKERWINLPNTKKQILARDHEAQRLLDALREEGPAILSIAAPPGFGKTAVFSLALRMAFSHGDPPETELSGIAVLDAKVDAPGIAAFSSLLGRVTGLQDTAARFASAAGASAGNGRENGARLRSLFFDFLRQAGKIWLVVENAEAVLAPAAQAGGSGDFRDLLKDWCKHDHEAKLLILTRHAPDFAPDLAPEGHRALRRIEGTLLGGLPEPAAVDLLRRLLKDTRFRETAESLLLQTVQKLHRVPMAIEQFAAYLRQREQGVELDQRFLDQNDLLRLDISEQLLSIVAQNLDLLDSPSLDLLRLVAWAAMPVPQSGLMAYRPDAAQLLTSVVRSNQLSALEGTAAEGCSFDMHPLIREALSERSGDGLDFARIHNVFLGAGNEEWNQTQFRPALALYTLSERAAREVDGRAEFAVAVMNRGLALWNLGRLEEAIAAHDESIVLYRELAEKERRPELRNNLARAIMNRSNTLKDLGRLEEAVAAYDESIAILHELVEKEHRREPRNDLAVSIMNRGNALKDLDRPEAALAAFDDSIDIYRELVEKEHRLELRSGLAMAIMNRGNALLRLGRLEEAVAAYNESIALRRELVEKEHRRELRNDLAMAIMNRGVALMNLGRLEEAIAAYAESIAVSRALVEKERRQELRSNLALALYNLALAREKRGAIPAALESAREARQLWQHAVNDGMKHLEPWLARAKDLETRLLNRLS
ncbi:MAG TPA: tetratricopeptide repeat protein [Bryobacteraceae bacterium]